MKILKNLFLGKKPVIRKIGGLGDFEFFKDGIDVYWQTETPVSNLPEAFDFGAVAGDINGPAAGALQCFRSIANQPDRLFLLPGDTFFELANQHLDGITASNIGKQFYLKSLTTSNIDNFEFGLHSRTKDIVIELFVRDGKVTEVFLDEGCCAG